MEKKKLRLLPVWCTLYSILTSYQAKVFAEELQLHHPSGEVRSLTSTLMGAHVDLNPHQVDAALFAFRSPLSRGILLADEVGLVNACSLTAEYPN